MSDKVHPPTPRRRQRAREQGRVPRSGDVVTAGILLATTGILSWQGPRIAAGLMRSLEQSFSTPLISVDRWDAMRLLVGAAGATALLVAPLLIAMMLIGVGVNLMQTGWLITPSKLAPSLDRVSPSQRFATLLSAAAMGRFVVSLVKLIAITSAAVAVARAGIPKLAMLRDAPLSQIGTTTFQSLTGICLWMGLTMLVFAGVDYALAWWQHERSLMMTEQELREELRDSERKSVQDARSRPVEKV